MTEIVPFPRDADQFEVLLRTGGQEHGPYLVEAETIGDGRAGDTIVFWLDSGVCVHGKIVKMWPRRK